MINIKIKKSESFKGRLYYYKNDILIDCLTKEDVCSYLKCEVDKIIFNEVKNEIDKRLLTFIFNNNEII